VNRQASALINQIEVLTLETDQLTNELPDSFDELQCTLKDLPLVLEKLNKRSPLDPNNVSLFLFNFRNN
jgi:hypothetical protein